MTIEDLKSVGEAERRLTLIEVEDQKKRLLPFKDHPEVARALSYLERFKDPIPRTHQIFSYIERQEKVQEAKGYQDDVSPEDQKKADNFVAEMNELVDNLEKELDKTFVYWEKNRKNLKMEYPRIAATMRLGRFLSSVKSNIRGVRIK